MLNYAARFGKRCAVLLPGLLIAVLSVQTIFPFIGKRLPFAFAVFVTYVIGAYILIPVFIRLIRIGLPARHLQSYCVTPDGFASDPLNIGIIGSKTELTNAMQQAGWHVADQKTPRTLAHLIVSAFSGRSYKNAPMSNLYLFGRRQDIGFELPIEGSRGHRHHVRFWATEYTPSPTLKFGTINWHQQGRKTTGKHTLWVGAASKDVGFALIRHNVQITHMIDPDTNAERQLIIKGLREAQLAADIKTFRVATKPYRLTNRVWRGQLHSDGYLKIVTLATKALTGR